MKNQIEEFIELTKDLNVLVVGETIVDEFIEVVYQGQSMKSFCPVFRNTNSPKEIQNGGVGAIVGHLTDFVDSVDLITNTKKEIVKTRFVDQGGHHNKHVELNKIDNANFGRIDINGNDYDAVILADYGHGFCDDLQITGGFHLMCQTNSHNFGFNRMSKWRKFQKKSICLDLREASLQVNHRMKECTDEAALELYGYEMNCADMYVTLGGEGSLLTNGKEIFRRDAVKSEIVDTIGAGDTFFSFCSLISTIGVSDEHKLLIPSLAASLSTTWLCNEESVTKKKLLEYADQKI